MPWRWRWGSLRGGGNPPSAAFRTAPRSAMAFEDTASSPRARPTRLPAELPCGAVELLRHDLGDAIDDHAGRPAIAQEIRDLIRRMPGSNPSWVSLHLERAVEAGHRRRQGHGGEVQGPWMQTAVYGPAFAVVVGTISRKIASPIGEKLLVSIPPRATACTLPTAFT